jgi:hypothetical protein
VSDPEANILQPEEKATTDVENYINVGLVGKNKIKEHR